MNWDDLRYVLAVANAGSLAGGARDLGVNHTTVLRRIGAFEKELGLRIFERLPTGYALTPGGEQLIAAARQVSETVDTLERKLAGRDLRLAGAIRVTTTDTLIGSILPEILVAFRDAYPGIEVDIAVSNLMVNLTKRDADVAIRPAKDPPETLVGRRVARIAFGIYGSARYLAAHNDKDLRAHRWVAPNESLADTSVARWMRSELPDVEIALRADSLLALWQMVRAGAGLGALPCYLGESHDGLTCLRKPIPEMETALWVLTHEDLRHTARIRAFMDFAAKAFAARRALLEGADATG
jgi:DNA-binding transcriptional LysR family regulator